MFEPINALVEELTKFGIPYEHDHAFFKERRGIIYNGEAIWFQSNDGYLCAIHPKDDTYYVFCSDDENVDGGGGNTLALSVEINQDMNWRRTLFRYLRQNVSGRIEILKLIPHSYNP